MPWVAGTRFGSYEILAPIGAGGMGEVYRARDTKLRRDVAVKVLPDQVAADPDRMMRFQREAEVLASLNHPNIAQIYGIEERAIIMELVEGATLADRIANGPLQVDEALTIARQIADALEAAHDKGITHRDLKPANVMVTRDGVVKVLDFGLAAIPSREPTADPANSPTLTAATQTGIIMGTAAYMSPEQAAGKPVDKRADIWSFGVVLWEMLTGKQLFSGETVSHTLADVLRAPIDLDKLPKETPLAVRELLRRCLSRDLKKRLRDIGDLPLLLDQNAQPQAARRVLTPILPWIVAATALVAALVIAGIHFREAPAAQPMPATFQFEPPGSLYTMVEVSPDGRYIAMSSRTSRVPIVIRPVNGLQTQPLPGTEGAQYPFWSPDSAYIGFFADGKLKKIALSGGAAQILCEGRGPASWGKEGDIWFGGGTLGKLQRVPATGGVPVVVMATSSAGGFARIDQVLPGGGNFLYSMIGGKAENSGIYVGSSRGSPAVRLLNDLSNAIYVPGKSSDRGYILFQRDKRLMAVPFDAHALKIEGDLLPVAEQVENVGFLYQFAFSASDNGILAYRSASNGGIRREFQWIDRMGKRMSVASKTARIGYFGLSADGARAVFQYLQDEDHTDLWVADVNRGSMSRFTFLEGVTYSPVWSPDGERIAFGFYDPKTQAWGVDLKAANGTAEQQVLTPIQGINASVYDWSRDGRFIVYGQQVAETKDDLWLLAPDGDRKSVPYLRTSANEIDAQFSPDGRWMAYASDESGRYQVYIQGVPAGPAKWQVSANGGIQPRWSHDGKELFYIAGDNMLTSVSVRTGASIEVGDPTALFRVDPLGPTVYAYAPAPDGRRFLVNSEAAGPVPPVTVVVDWRALLKR